MDRIVGGIRDGVAEGLGDRAYLRFVELLSSDAFPRGTKLPAETELARQLAVSRPVLHQALSWLRMEGRVRTRKGSGTHVQAAPKTAPIAFDPPGSIPDVRSFLEFRCSVEGEIAAHAALHAGRTGLKAIQAACHKLEAEIQEGRPGIEEDAALPHGVGALGEQARRELVMIAVLRPAGHERVDVAGIIGVQLPADRHGG